VASLWRPHLFQEATAVACIQRVDGQGVDSKLFPWTEEEDGAVAVGLGRVGPQGRGEGEVGLAFGPDRLEAIFL
jgi:hypothetical protein